MYHEAEFEMEQLLQSIGGIDAARKKCDRQFESHIFFDDGARGQVSATFASSNTPAQFMHLTLKYGVLQSLF